MSVRGAVFTGVGHPVQIVDDIGIDSPKAGEALVDIEVAGICGSDLAIVNGKMPFPTPVLLGHEASGTVVEVGPQADGLEPGARVVVWMRPPCRACRACVRGEAALCERSGFMSARGTLLDGRTSFTRGGDPLYRAFGIGAFSTQVVMPVNGLVPVPDDVPTNVATLVSCGVATGAGAVLNVAHPQPADVVLVFGAGGVGLAAVMAAAATGAGAVIVVDPAEHRRRQALEVGADHTIEGGDRDEIREQLKEAMGNAIVDVVIDAVGRSELVETGYRLVRQGGTVVAVGLQDKSSKVTLPGMVVPISHKRLCGCFMGGVDPQRDIPRIFSLYRRGAFPIDRLVSAVRPLDEVPEALDDLAAARGLRTVIDLKR